MGARPIFCSIVFGQVWLQAGSTSTDSGLEFAVRHSQPLRRRNLEVILVHPQTTALPVSCQWKMRFIEGSACDGLHRKPQLKTKNGRTPKKPGNLGQLHLCF